MNNKSACSTIAAQSWLGGHDYSPSSSLEEHLSGNNCFIHLIHLQDHFNITQQIRSCPLCVFMTEIPQFRILGKSRKMTNSLVLITWVMLEGMMSRFPWAASNILMETVLIKSVQ